jgi:methylthioribose-1-phosphate isomerase
MSISTQVYPVIWKEDRVLLIDQTRLPKEYAIVEIHRYEDIARAISTMIVRGAPAIGIAAAYGMYLGARDLQTDDRDRFLAELEEVGRILGNTRPTAVNLFWAIERMLETARNAPGSVAEIRQTLLSEARAIQAEDLGTCQEIGDRGLAVLPKTPERLNILTHCNAGSLATAG